MKKRSVVAAFAAVFLVLSTAGMVFASSLTLGSPVRPSLFAASKCATGSAEVMVSDGSAAVSVPEGCESVDLKLYVAENDQAHSVGFAPGTTVSLPAGFKAPKAALVTADTWPLATDLKVDSGPPIIDDEPFTCKVGSGTCSIERQEILWGDGTVFGFTMAITSDSPTPVEWELSINLSSSWFPFVAGGLADQGGGALVKVSSSECSDPVRIVTVKGNKEWGMHVISQGAVRQFWLTARLTPDGFSNLISCP